MLREQRPVGAAAALGSVPLLALCLLLHGAPSAAAQAPREAAKPADNSACMVCHQDFQQEVITVAHQKAGVGCTHCHGRSADHGGDELNILSPDVLFGRTEIQPFCGGCHNEAEHPQGEAYQAFLTKWLGKYRPNGRVIRKNAVCTDCHGNHAVLSPDQMQFPQE